MSCWTCVVVTVYAIGFLVAPFFYALTDGWPFVKPRVDGVDGSVVFVLALFWPLVFVVWGLYVWWTLNSFAGAKAHKAIKCKIERVVGAPVSRECAEEARGPAAR